MSQYRQQGYKAGFSDGKKGATKDVRRHLSAFKVLLSGKYVDDFVDGYEDGHAKGLEEWCKKHC